MQIANFKSYLTVFASPKTDEDLEKEDDYNVKLEEEVEKMGTYLSSLMDLNYKGTISQTEFIGLV